MSEIKSYLCTYILGSWGCFFLILAFLLYLPQCFTQNKGEDLKPWMSGYVGGQFHYVTML